MTLQKEQNEITLKLTNHVKNLTFTLKNNRKPLKCFKQRKATVHVTLEYQSSVYQYNLQWIKDLEIQKETMKILGDVEQFLPNLEVKMA